MSRGAKWAAWSVAAGIAVLYLMTAGQYGVFRNELYFIVCGRHPAFGYVDQPPIVPLLAAATQVAGVNIWLLRLPAILAAAALVPLTVAYATLLGASDARRLAIGCDDRERHVAHRALGHTIDFHVRSRSRLPPLPISSRARTSARSRSRTSGGPESSPASLSKRGTESSCWAIGLAVGFSSSVRARSSVRATVARRRDRSAHRASQRRMASRTRFPVSRTRPQRQFRKPHRFAHRDLPITQVFLMNFLTRTAVACRHHRTICLKRLSAVPISCPSRSS